MSRRERDREEERPRPEDPEGEPSGPAALDAEGHEQISAEEGRTAAAADDADSEAISDEIRRELEELDELRDRHLRLAAEFENYRKRTRQELLKTREMAQAELAGRLLDALDDLSRVGAIPAESTSVEALHEGVELVERKLRKELREAGLEPVEAEGRPFDPTLHEALASTPTDDPDEDDVVSRVFVTGYRFGDRLVRPARVEVKKYHGDDREDGARSAGGG